MKSERCPGQDQRYWKPEDIQTVPCPGCGEKVEIWKDEPLRACPACGKDIPNPKIDPTCARWCPSSKDCPGAQGPKGAPGAE